MLDEVEDGADPSHYLPSTNDEGEVSTRVSEGARERAAFTSDPLCVFYCVGPKCVHVASNAFFLLFSNM